MCGGEQISEDFSVSDERCMGEEGGKGGWKIWIVTVSTFLYFQTITLKFKLIMIVVSYHRTLL